MSTDKAPISLFSDIVNDQHTNDHLKDIIASHEGVPPLEVLLQQLTQKATHSLTMTEHQTKACHQLVQAAVQTDRVTHLHDSNFDSLMVDAANLHSKTKQKDAFIISGDFSNLYNCNKALDKKATNEIMAIIIDIYKQELHKVSPQLMYGSRHGGDEFRFILTGVPEEKLEVAIGRAQERIQQFVSTLGLDHLQHSKEVGNPVKSGIGAEVAWKKFPVIPFPSYELDAELDNMINEKKIISGQKKLTTKQISLEDPSDIANSKERLEHIHRVIDRYREDKQHTLQEHTKAFPFHHAKPEQQAHNIFKQRENQVKEMANQLNMNQEQAKFFHYLLDDIYDKKDKNTGLHKNRDFIHSLNDEMSKAKNDGTECFLIRMEAYNFSSLNAVLYHHGNDVLFMRLAEIAAKHLETLGSLSFYRGGGIIAPIVTGKSAAEINKALEAIVDEFYKTIGNKSIKEFCRENHLIYSKEGLAKLNITENTKICDVPSIRGFKPGSGFVIAKADLRQSANFNDALAKVDHLSEQNRIQGISLETDAKTTYLNGKTTVVKQEKAQKPTQSTMQIFQMLGVKEAPVYASEAAKKKEERTTEKEVKPGKSVAHGARESKIDGNEQSAKLHRSLKLR